MVTTEIDGNVEFIWAANGFYEKSWATLYGKFVACITEKRCFTRQREKCQKALGKCSVVRKYIFKSEIFLRQCIGLSAQVLSTRLPDFDDVKNGTKTTYGGEILEEEMYKYFPW